MKSHIKIISFKFFGYTEAKKAIGIQRGIMKANLKNIEVYRAIKDNSHVLNLITVDIVAEVPNSVFIYLKLKSNFLFSGKPLPQLVPKKNVEKRYNIFVRLSLAEIVEMYKEVMCPHKNKYVREFFEKVAGRLIKSDNNLRILLVRKCVWVNKCLEKENCGYISTTEARQKVFALNNYFERNK